MGLQVPLRTSFNLPDGREITLETGKLATLADGSAMLRMGNTMLLATFVSAKKAKEGQPFFPLSVDYQEKFSAAGRIPGNFFRREGKISDYEVLISRLIDRALRPLFPDGYMNETQLMISLISVDKDVMPDALAGLVASTAVAVSNVPVEALFAECRVARIDGKLVINPGRAALAKADMQFIVAATKNDITMVEGEANECQEADLVEAMKYAHETIKTMIAAQEKLAEMVGPSALVKREVKPLPENLDLKKRIESAISEPIRTIASSATDKTTRRDFIEKLKETTLAAIKTENEADADFWKTWAETADRYFEKIKKHVIRDVVLTDGKRLDGRKLDEVRPIWCEVDYLPSAHGSALFNRGETQALTSLTLGTKQDQQMIDNAMEKYDEKFILHYNFPAFSVGEARPNRGPGRREVGHANLAAHSIKKVMPVGFPYTVRIVSDILESNGSSSMATVCAGSLALMDGGVPMRAPVAGIAMGCIADDKGRIAVLTDILGDEDALGDMDFKVTGTANGIVGAQMDIKIDGMPYDLLTKALLQAKKGRLHILGKMNEVLGKANADLKPHAPRVLEFRIPKTLIGAVIGPGGKIIQEIQATSGTVISITEDETGGIVSIFGPDKNALDMAYARVNDIVFMPEVGVIYEGEVEELVDFGAFIKFKGKTGLMHVSEIAHNRIGDASEVFQVGDTVQFKLLDIDQKTGKMKLSRRAILPKPDGSMPTDEENDSRTNRGGGGDRGGDRGGRGGGGFRDGGGRDDRRGGGRDDDRRGGGGGFRGGR